MCEDCRAEMEETLKKQNEELASEKDEILG
jgi:hypothetical protein